MATKSPTAPTNSIALFRYACLSAFQLFSISASVFPASAQTDTITVSVNGNPITNNYYLLPFGATATNTIATSFPDDTIFFTTNGDPVSFLSPTYSGPFITTTSIVVQSFAVDWNDYDDDGTAVITNFIQFVPSYTLSNLTPGGGTVSLSPPLTAGSYGSNTLVTLTANPAPGWSFAYWTGGVSGTNPILSVLMTNNLAVSAIFVTRVRLAGSPLNYGTVVGSPPPLSGGLYAYGTVVQVSAVPNLGNYFWQWAITNLGTSSPITVAVTNTNINCTALFNPLPAPTNVTLSLIANGPGTVTASPSSDY